MYSEVSLIMKQLDEVLTKYRDHPDFLGLDLKTANQRGATDDTPLHIAARKGELVDISVLCAHGGDVNLPGDLGNTPLHYAAMSGQLDAATLLLRLGADPALLNEFSQTPVQVAEIASHMDIVKAIGSFRR